MSENKLSSSEVGRTVGRKENFANLFEQNFATLNMKPGSLLSGVVMDVDKDWVTIHVGLKSEGVVPVLQFLGEDGGGVPSVGDEVEVVLEYIDNGLGQTGLSREKARRAVAWRKLELAKTSGSSVTGRITSKVRGGFIVEVDSLSCFLPASLVDIQPISDATFLENRDLEFKVVRLEEERNNIVVSRRAVLEEEMGTDRETQLANMSEGQVVKGTVKNLTEYGAFVDLGGIDGLLHVTDMSWRRISRPKDIVSIGDRITVKILRFDPDNGRISLGMKQLEEDPWQELKKRYPAGSKIQVQVTKLMDYGCFARVEEGVEGLVHLSEMDWVEQNQHPSRLVQIGDSVEVMVLEINAEQHRISLSIKRCRPNPWENFATSHSVGDILAGKVKAITDFGLFVVLEGGVPGLVHVSDLPDLDDGQKSAGKDQRAEGKTREQEAKDGKKRGDMNIVEKLMRSYRKGDELEMVLLGIDVPRERIALGVRQLKLPIIEYAKKNPIGSKVSGRVIRTRATTAELEMGGHVTGLLHASEIGREDVKDVREVIENGSEVKGRVMDIDYKRGVVTISIRSLEEEDEEQAIRMYRQKNADDSRPSLAEHFEDSKQANQERD